MKRQGPAHAGLFVSLSVVRQNPIFNKSVCPKPPHAEYTLKITQPYRNQCIGFVVKNVDTLDIRDAYF